MYFKVRITKGLPQAKTGGFTGNNLNKQVISFGGADMNAASRHLENTRYLKKVPRDEANLEAEGGETAFGDINGDGFTEHMIINGKRHHEGGVPLNLPDGTFIFSDTASMKITDCNILKMFNKACGKKGYTPAELAKPYDLNMYRKILEDPNSDKIDKKSAELMIKNINLKLGALALAQEAKKGFPQGIPEVAKPYMEEMGIREEDLMPQKIQPEAQVNEQAMQNPYENQGMGMQSPEEEMMEQGPGMQNPQEEMMEAPPMAQYGMAMGDYGYANDQFNSENNSENNQSTSSTGFFSNLFGGNNKRRIKNKKNTVINNYYGVPQQGNGNNQSQPSQNSYNTYNTYSTKNTTNPNSSQNEEHQDNWNTVRHVEPTTTPSYGTTTSGASPRFSQGTFGPNGYNAPKGYKNGGSLTQYQKKGEVKSKIYTKDDLPKDAVVREKITIDTRSGDFIKQEDGTYKKVTASTLSKTPTADSKSLGLSVDEFKKQSPENAKLIEDANAIIEKGIKNGTIKNKNGEIKITGDWDGDFKDRIILSRALNATNAKGVFGTDKYKIVSQGATGPYSKLDEKTKKLKGTGSFVAGFTPDLYEQRFVFEQAKGLGMSDDEAFDEVDRIQKDPKLKAQVRRQFASTLGIKDVPEDDKALLSDDFYKKNYSDVTKGIENLVGESSYRPAIGNEQLSGFEHFDAIGGKPEFQYEEDVPVTEDDAEKADEEVAAVEQQYPEAGNPEWWLQDKVNMALAAGDYFDVQKALPWAARYEPQMISPTFYDPTRELAAQSEQANIADNAMAQFLGPQAASVRSSARQAQSAKQAADTLSRYNNQNVTISNQIAGNNAQIANEAQRFNQAQNKQLYDQNVIANQQYKNTKRALRQNLGQAYNTGVTNMMKTDALNQMYPQYAVDPSTGGRMHFTRGRLGKPTNEMSADEYAMQLRDSNLDEESKKLLLKDYIKRHGSGSSSDEVDPNIIGTMYGKKGGTTKMAYVMGSNVFPFMFY